MLLKCYLIISLICNTNYTIIIAILLCSAISGPTATQNWTNPYNQKAHLWRIKTRKSIIFSME